MVNVRQIPCGKLDALEREFESIRKVFLGLKPNEDMEIWWGTSEAMKKMMEKELRR